MSGSIFSATGCMSMFSMLYNLFHHTPRMIFDPFLMTQRATSREILGLQGGDTEQPWSASLQLAG